MAAHLAFHLGEYAFALRQCQKAFENKASVPAVQQEDLLVDTVHDFFASGHETTDVSTVEILISSPDLKIRKSCKQFMLSPILSKNEKKLT